MAIAYTIVYILPHYQLYDYHKYYYACCSPQSHLIFTSVLSGYLDMPQAGQEATSTDKPITKCPKNMSEAG